MIHLSLLIIHHRNWIIHSLSHAKNTFCWKHIFINMLKTHEHKKHIFHVNRNLICVIVMKELVPLISFACKMGRERKIELHVPDVSEKLSSLSMNKMCRRHLSAPDMIRKWKHFYSHSWKLDWLPEIEVNGKYITYQAVGLLTVTVMGRRAWWCVLSRKRACTSWSRPYRTFVCLVPLRLCLQHHSLFRFKWKKSCCEDQRAGQASTCLETVTSLPIGFLSIHKVFRINMSWPLWSTQAP